VLAPEGAAGIARDGWRPKTNARETVKRKERNGRIVDDDDKEREGLEGEERRRTQRRKKE
jgi:hypothetical protein